MLDKGPCCLRGGLVRNSADIINVNNSERQFYALFIKYIHVLRDWECTLRENVDQYAEKAHWTP